jgi:DNA helicase II / ATP-dependent DNA helicase PcrA
VGKPVNQVIDPAVREFVKEGARKHVESTAPVVITKPSNPRMVLLAFNKHIAVELQGRLSKGGTGHRLNGSDEQEAIWEEAVKGTRHMMVQAVAGSGKTTVLIETSYRMGGTTEAMTYHSLGFKACAKAFGRVKVEQYKTYQILDGMHVPVASHQEKVYKARVVKLVSLAKQYAKVDRAQLEWIVDHHDIELNGMEELILDVVPKVLKKCSEMTSQVDFDDMIWLPRVLELDVPRYDVVMSDEAQDLNVIQQYLALKAGDRHIVVGDSRQAIYGFRGADSHSMESMRAMLAETARGVVDMPLTLTRRCPKSHVALANRIVPQIRAMSDAPEGKVSVMPVNEAVNAMKPGDMVLCRVNAPLLKTAYQLLKRGVKAVVRGRDIGQSIVRLIDKAEQANSDGYHKALSIPDLVKLTGEITDKEVAKFNAIPNGRGEQRAQVAQDKYDCLLSMTDGLRWSGEVRYRIENLFADFDVDGQPKHAVVLSTVHRGKGLEAGRVFVLRPDLIPHPMAKQAHDVASEMNLAYVAVTRAKFSGDGEGELVFVGMACELFGEVNDEDAMMNEQRAYEDYKHDQVRKLKGDMR